MKRYPQSKLWRIDPTRVFAEPPREFSLESLLLSFQLESYNIQPLILLWSLASLHQIGSNLSVSTLLGISMLLKLMKSRGFWARGDRRSSVVFQDCTRVGAAFKTNLLRTASLTFRVASVILRQSYRLIRVTHNLVDPVQRTETRNRKLRVTHQPPSQDPLPPEAYPARPLPNWKWKEKVAKAGANHCRRLNHRLVRVPRGDDLAC